MIRRTKLSERSLPNYTLGEELLNTISHGLGALFGIAALVLCLIKAASTGTATDITAAAIYGASLIALYTVSSVYHGLRPCTAKKVMQVIDHCTIYFLICGSYTVVALTGLRETYPTLAWGMVIFQCALTILAITLTAIDLKAFEVFSMICYIGMGWAIIPFAGRIKTALGAAGFGFLLAGGIAYTVGAILYGLGTKKRWMHSVFHIFVVLGSVLQFCSIYWFSI